MCLSNGSDRQGNVKGEVTWLNKKLGLKLLGLNVEGEKWVDL